MVRNAFEAKQRKKYVNEEVLFTGILVSGRILKKTYRGILTPTRLVYLKLPSLEIQKYIKLTTECKLERHKNMMNLVTVRRMLFCDIDGKDA
jgi:hypothetical protein